MAAASPMTHKRIACLITGVPKDYGRCAPTLRFLLGEWKVSYFAVMREEFATDETLIALQQHIPQVQIIVVPAVETATAGQPFVHLGVNPTVVSMWHEIWYACNRLAGFEAFCFVFRTRFDVFFHAQYLPDVAARTDSDVWLPEQLSWAGSNDMVCLAAPSAFRKYAMTYAYLPVIIAEGIAVPEQILSRAFALSRLTEKRLDVFFVLYRAPLFAGLSDVQLHVLAHAFPELSTFKLGGPNDSPEERDRCIGVAKSLTDQESEFPVFANPHTGENFYGPEKDSRDGSTFRWMAAYAKVCYALPVGVNKLEFVVHFFVPGWSLDNLVILVDGNRVSLYLSGEDPFGRLIVCGYIHQDGPYRRPSSNIVFSSSVFISPGQPGWNPSDSRTLSVALGSLRFSEQREKTVFSRWRTLLTSPFNRLKRVRNAR
jgi:hypothetical protein